jgi:hypothetical protein
MPQRIVRPNIQSGAEVPWHSTFKMLPLISSDIWATPYNNQFSDRDSD